jgi:hypothetical protein
VFSLSNGQKLSLVILVVTIFLFSTASLIVNALPRTEVQYWEGIGNVLWSNSVLLSNERGFPTNVTHQLETTDDFTFMRLVVNADAPEVHYIHTPVGYILAPLDELPSNIGGQLIVYRGIEIIGAVEFENMNEYAQELQAILVSPTPIIEIRPQPGLDYLFSGEIYCQSSDVEGLKCSIQPVFSNRLDAVYKIGDYCYLYSTEVTTAPDYEPVQGPVFIPVGCSIMVRYPSFLPEVPEYFR